MATAGSGDVLTGIITALLARGYQQRDACVVGMYLHGLAGDIAANLRRARGRGTTGADAYAALASARRRTAPASAELGKKIMASRNSNYRKSV